MGGSLYENAEGLNDEEAAELKCKNTNKSNVTTYWTASRITVPQIQSLDDFPHTPKYQVQSDDNESTLVCYLPGETSIDLPLLTLMKPHLQVVCPEGERRMCHR